MPPHGSSSTPLSNRGSPRWRRKSPICARAAALPSPPISPFRPLWDDAVVAHDERAAYVTAAWKELTTAWDAAHAAYCRAAEEAAQAERERRAAEQERRTAAMRAWIAEHGSARLRTLVDGGYPVWREYVRERTAREFPEFVADLDKRAVWRNLNDDDVSPTNAQIALARRCGGRTVWLVRPPHDEPTRGVVAVVIADSPIGVSLIEAAAVAAGDDEEHPTAPPRVARGGAVVEQRRR